MILWVRSRAVRAGSFTVCLSAAASLWAATQAPSWQDYAKRPAEWYRSADGRRVIENILSWQSAEGSWPKNQSTTATPFDGDRTGLCGTFDNGATTGELRFLARAFRFSGEPRCRAAFDRGLDHILKAQYPTGGWPQFYPPGPQYHRHITFNDDTMVRLLELLREVADEPDYAFVENDRRQAARNAFDRGIQCILRCQVKVNGQLTAWCAQHDEVDYRPRAGRAYELASLSGAESAGILGLLMSLDQPDPAVIRAVTCGAGWFELVKITGVRVEKVGGDRRVVKAANAPPLWARFYEIESNRPIFCGRDGVKKYHLREIEAERRNGYAWYGSWGEKVAADYARWKVKWPR
jgi:PelA/Pel-15E family pectate lyase